jgi:hypothetical protein
VVPPVPYIFLSILLYFTVFVGFNPCKTTFLNKVNWNKQDQIKNSVLIRPQENFTRFTLLFGYGKSKIHIKRTELKKGNFVYLFYNYQYSRFKYLTGEQINPKFWIQQVNEQRNKAVSWISWIQYKTWQIENAIKKCI